jgi:tetratricopeptide (TPR) repeat protein
MKDAENCLVFSFLDYLEDKQGFDDEAKRMINNAKDSISKVYQLDIHNQEERSKYLLSPSLLTIVKRCRENGIDAETLKEEGNREFKAQRYSEAIDLYTKALVLNENPVYYCNRAAAHASLDNSSEAILDCQRALRIDPTYAKAYKRLGASYQSQKNYSEALNAYTNAQKYDPSDKSIEQLIEHLRIKVGKKGFDIGDIMKDPLIANAAKNLVNSGALKGLLDNPEISQMAQNIFGGNFESIKDIFKNGESQISDS